MKFDDHFEEEPSGPTCPRCGSDRYRKLYTWPTRQFEGYDCQDCGYEADEHGVALKEEADDVKEEIGDAEH